MILWLRILLCFLFPTSWVRIILNRLGWKIEKGAKIGFSIIKTPDLIMNSGSQIGSLNLLIVHSLECGAEAKIGHGNRTKGMILIHMKEKSAIGNFNLLLKASSEVKKQTSTLSIGVNSKITSRHYIDCLSNITIHNEVVIGGIGSQIWTHGYYHFPDNNRRARIDGSVEIGDFCFIGSHCVINPGVKICSGVSVGSHSNVSKSISSPGLYVSQPLRKIDKSPEDTLGSMTKGNDQDSIEEHYVKEL